MFKPATKTQIKVRLAISGASGSGKTYSALSIASHLGKSIAVIDTEHGSASRYADLFNFQVCELTNHHPAKYIEAIQAAEAMGFEVIIIDSLSHAWFESLNLAGGRFDGWKNVRPLERKLIDAMLGSRAHIIVTMRSKTEYVMEETTNKAGRQTTSPRKVGTAPIQREGIEYEFDLAGEMDYNHILTISKSRCPQIADKTYLYPGAELAQELQNWINSAQPAPALQPPQPAEPQPIYKSWKSEQDAIDWAAEQLPGWDIDEIKLEFEEISATNGKKAPAFVERITYLANR